jgi:hypothetical protein
MNDRLVRFLDDMLQRYFDRTLDECPPMSRSDLERLLTDDGQRRAQHARAAAAKWAETEAHGRAAIMSERVMITPRGLLYAATLSALPGRSLFYLATPQVFFEPMADRLGTASRPAGSPAAVDSRFRSDLVFLSPLDRPLRRRFDTDELLRLGASPS